MTRAETKRDIRHLYGHWLNRMVDKDAKRKAVLFYEWLKSMDTGILNYGDFGDGAAYHHIAVWVEEWEREPRLHRTQNAPLADHRRFLSNAMLD